MFTHNRANEIRVWRMSYSDYGQFIENPARKRKKVAGLRHFGQTERKSAPGAIFRACIQKSAV